MRQKLLMIKTLRRILGAIDKWGGCEEVRKGEGEAAQAAAWRGGIAAGADFPLGSTSLHSNGLKENIPI